MKLLRTVLVIALLAIAVSLPAQEIKVACIGNSITAGAGISDAVNDSYPAQLQKLLGDGYRVVNCGNSGRTMLRHGDYPLWVEPQFKTAVELVPDIVLILLGTNDTKPYNWIYKDEYIPDYIAMIDTFRAVNPNAKIYACLPPPAFSVQWDIRDSVIVADIMPMIRQIADSMQVDTVNFYQPLIDKRALFPDDIHPNAEGAWEMAKVAYKALTGNEVVQIQDENVALRQSVVLADGSDGGDMSPLVDNDLFTVWQHAGPASLVFDLGLEQSIDMLQVFFTDDFAKTAPRYTIEVAGNAGAWQTVVDESARLDTTALAAVHRITPVAAKSIRLTVVASALPGDMVQVADFRALKTAPAHAPALYIDNIAVRSTNTQYEYFVLPCNDGGYLKVVRSSAIADPFTDIKGYRLSEAESARSSIRPDRVQRYFTKAYYNGVEATSCDTLTIDWAISAVAQKPGTQLPQDFGLAQNYPNPFNPVTKIDFQMPVAGHVELIVFNALGKRVRTLVHETQPAGYYSAMWDGKNDRGAISSSGLYYCRLVVDGETVQTRKMALLR